MSKLFNQLVRLGEQACGSRIETTKALYSLSGISDDNIKTISKAANLNTLHSCPVCHSVHY